MPSGRVDTPARRADLGQGNRIGIDEREDEDETPLAHRSQRLGVRWLLFVAHSPLLVFRTVQSTGVDVAERLI